MSDNGGTRINPYGSMGTEEALESRFERRRSGLFKKRVNALRSSKTGRNIELAVVAPVMWVGSLGYFTGALALEGARPIAKGVKERALDIAAVFSEQRGDNIEPMSAAEARGSDTSLRSTVSERFRQTVSSVEIGAEAVFSGLVGAFQAIRQHPLEGMLTGATGGLSVNDNLTDTDDHFMTVADAGVPVGHRPGGEV